LEKRVKIREHSAIELFVSLPKRQGIELTDGVIPSSPPLQDARFFPNFTIIFVHKDILSVKEVQIEMKTVPYVVSRKNNENQDDTNDTNGVLTLIFDWKSIF